MFSSYDNWKTTDPRDSEREVGMVDCPDCQGEGHGCDEDGPWYCPTCSGEGWLWEEVLEVMEAEEELDAGCPRCGGLLCNCVNIEASIEAMMAGKEEAA